MTTIPPNAPNQRILFIPHKTMPDVKQPEYGNDMREIEIWARRLASRTTAGAVRFSASITAGVNGSIVAWNSIDQPLLNTVTVDSYYPVFAGDTGYPPNAFVSGTQIEIPVGGGGCMVSPDGGQHIFNPTRVDAPSFIGPASTIEFLLFLEAVQVATTAPATNAFKTRSNALLVASGAHHVLVAGDFGSTVIRGTDLTFGGTPLALTSAAGLPYIVSWNVVVVWDTRNTLTQQ